MTATEHGPDTRGLFGGQFGGKYVPETLMPALAELETAYAEAMADPEFRAELDGLLSTYVGRPTPLTFAARLTERVSAGRGGPKVYLKREDLAHTGAHKINAVLGQGLLARRMGKHAHHRGDRRRPARRRDRDGLRAPRLRVRRLHGRRGRPTSVTQRLPDEGAGC